LLPVPEISVTDALKILPGTPRSGRTLFKGLVWMRQLRDMGAPMIHDVLQPVIEGTDRAEAVAYTHADSRRRIEASLVLLHNGVIPATQMSHGAGCKQIWDAGQHCWQPQTDAWGTTSQDRIAVAGDGASILGATAAACLGRLAALDAAVRLGKLDAAQRDRMARNDRAELVRQQSLRSVLDRLFAPAAELLAPPTADDIVCRCENVTVDELHDAITQGSTDLNRVKAFTRCGMGPCQGRLCGPVAAEVIARALGQRADQPGQFRVRLPVRPVPLAELAELQ
jgi:bacterioferritin-associated ferredoxin